MALFGEAKEDGFIGMASDHPGAHTTRAVFLDRDGTLVEDVGYVRALVEFSVLPGVVDALAQLKDAGFLLIVVTNQAGVAKGIVDPAFPDEAFEYLRTTLSREGRTLLDGGYHCPHHPEGVVEGLAVACRCRKPEPGMLDDARRDFGIALDRSYVVGDHLSDVGLARRVGARAVLVLTGHGRQESAKISPDSRERQPDFIAQDLLDAAQWILRSEAQRMSSTGCPARPLCPVRDL